MKWLISSNIFVSVCTASLVLQTYFLSGSAIDINFLSLVFLSTLLTYCFHRLVKFRDENLTPTIDYKKKTLVFLSISSMVLLIPIALRLSESQFWWLSFSAVLTFLYSLGFISYQNQFWPLRKVPFLKLFLIAIIWSVVTVLIPLSDIQIEIESLAVLFAERFFFILAITIPFDIRDMKSDEKEGIVSLPIYFGRKTSYNIAFIFLMLFGLSCLFGLMNKVHNWIVFSGLLVSAILAFLELNKKNEDQPYYTSFEVEGLSLWQSTIVGLSYLLAGSIL